MHIPVLLDEAMEWLAVRPEGIYVDATIGAGGHARAILERLTTGHLIGIDKDPAAIEMARTSLQAYGDRLTLVRQDFAELLPLLRRLGWSGVDGILADIGLSQMQLDSPERGFSLKAEGPLDMRMNPDQRLTAEQIVNRYGERELAQLIYQFGEERRSQRIARAIVRARPIRNTMQLAELVAACLGGRRKTSHFAHRRRGEGSGAARTIIHPATRTFQAIRIAVNGELDSLNQFLNHTPECLLPGGRVVIICFHSLEDRLVKQHIRRWVQRGFMRSLTRHVVRPSSEEVRRNRRSRSARLRAAERTGLEAALPPAEEAADRR
jgi:16S rRNA (cytosine1402-N4)-methyltransferase